MHAPLQSFLETSQKYSTNNSKVNTFLHFNMFNHGIYWNINVTS